MGQVAMGTGRTYRGNMTIAIEVEPETTRRQAPAPSGGSDTDGRRTRGGKDPFAGQKPETAFAPAADKTDRAHGADDAVRSPGQEPEGWQGPVAVRPRRPAAAGAVRPVLLRWWAVVLAVGVTVATMIEPVPDGPHAADSTPAWIGAIGDVTLILLFTAFVALLAGRRWGLGAATYASAGLVTLSALCPTSGHHDVAAWWFGQLAISVGLFFGSLALRSRASAPARP